MKNLLLLLTLIIGSSALAQSDLFVRPTPSGGDNYIYVKDQILYVEDDVNLQVNNNTATEASIYLRDRGQLIQGTNSANTGTGFLSVFQDSYSDSYDYNYWASPVGNPATLGGGAIPGNKRYGIKSLKDSIGATNYRENITTAGYNGAGSGLGNGAIQLTISNRWIHKYESDAAGWSRIFNADNISAGYGFTMKGTNVTPAGGNQFQDLNNQRYDFRGRPNNGDIVVPMTANGYVLSGNPYPSALDLVAFYNDNPDLNSIIFWDEDRSINSHFYRDNQGGYGTWTVNTTNPNGIYTVPTFMNHDNSGNPTTPTGTVGQMYNRSVSPIGQGYFLVGEPGIIGSVPITYNNSHRVFFKETEDPTGGSVFHRPGGELTQYNTDETIKGTSQENTRGSMFRFYTVFGESHFRDMILFIGDDTTDGHDRGYDVYHPSDGGGTDISFPITASDNVERQYVMQGVPFIENERKFIPLTIKVSSNNYKIEVKGIEEVNIPADIYFYDISNDNAQLISGENSAGIRLSPGTYKNRFYLVLNPFRNRPSPLMSFQEEEAITEINDIKQNVNFFQNNRASQLEVTNPDRLNITAANIYDMGGKLVVSQNNIGEESKFNIPTSNLSDGVYLVKLTTVENVSIDYKMTVTN